MDISPPWSDVDQSLLDNMSPLVEAAGKIKILACKSYNFIQTFIHSRFIKEKIKKMIYLLPTFFCHQLAVVNDICKSKMYRSQDLKDIF